MVVARWIIACREQQHDTCFLASMFFSCYHTRKSFFFLSLVTCLSREVVASWSFFTRVSPCRPWYYERISKYFRDYIFFL